MGPAVLVPVVVSGSLTSVCIVSGLGLSFSPLALHTKALAQMSRDEIEALLELDKRKVRLIPHTSRYTCDGDGKEYEVHARWYEHQVNPVQFSQPVPIAFYSHFPKTHVCAARESVEDPPQIERACC